ncbi:universal stress protein [Actinoplanes sp. CA-051413]|uniref:universal stress protein n=1 Tax=Actinoplanes sp. CA-051413 TaxID=3239899 RepID=UPI003D9775C3
MTTAAEQVRIIVGYDGSPPASAAIDAGTALFPRAHAWITNLWTPPFASEPLRRRLWTGSRHIDEFVEAVEAEGEREADRLAANGVTLARAAGWAAEPLVRRVYSGEGLELGQLAGEFGADLILLGSRGLGGAKALLGSVSDMAVHHTPCPALVVAHPLLAAEAAALADGPVVVGWDGSPGARHAGTAAPLPGPGTAARLRRPDFARTGRRPGSGRRQGHHGPPRRSAPRILVRRCRDPGLVRP